MIDKELTKQIKQRKDSEAEKEKLKKTVNELHNLLRAAATSDEKKTAMLEELKIGVQEER